MTMVERAARGVADEARELQVQPWCLSYARAALLAALDAEDEEAVARKWKPWAFDETAAYYPYRGAIRRQAIIDAAEIIAALRSLAQGA